MISLSLALLSLTSAVHRQGHRRVPGPPSALVIVRHLGITQPVNSDRHIAVTRGTAKLQAHHGLLQYHLTDRLGGDSGLPSSAALSVSFRDEVHAQASSYQEANERLGRNSGLFVLYSEEQNSDFMGKNAST